MINEKTLEIPANAFCNAENRKGLVSLGDKLDAAIRAYTTDVLASCELHGSLMRTIYDCNPHYGMLWEDVVRWKKAGHQASTGKFNEIAKIANEVVGRLESFMS